MVGMAALWGASWPAGRVVAQTMPPVSAAAWRFTLATALLVAWWCVVHRTAYPRLRGRQWAGLALGGLVGVYVYAMLFVFALQRVDASRAALVVTTNPVFTTLLAAWFFKERLNARILLGMALAMLGAAVVLTHGAPWRLFSTALGVAEWMLLGCIAAWTGYTLIGRALLTGIDSLTATTVTAVVGMVMLWATAWAWEGPEAALHALADLSPQAWFSLLFLSVGSTVLAYAWYNQGIAALGASAAASYISLVPVFGVASAVWALGETLDDSLWLGGTLAVLGLIVNNRARR
jgi:drug/metabolite transporter (DMT)-like permease